MDIESFENIKLHALDFTDEAIDARKRGKTPVSEIPLPDEMPAAFNASQIPREILKSSTIENLISQNEDLMARLKVSIRRLALLESENQKLSEEAQRARLSQSAVADQILILKEKDGIWKQKLDQTEQEKEVHSERANAFQQRLQKLTAEVERHQKYHERIRTQVKPYIHQLKEYSRNLEAKTETQSKECSKLEAQISDLRYQIAEVTKNSRLQVEIREKQAHEMVQFYEQQLHNQTEELKSLQGSHQELEIRALRLNKALEKQDELENQVVELLRSKEELKTRLEKEVVRLQDKTADLHRQNSRLEIEHTDLRDLALTHEERIKSLEKDKTGLTEQLDSLRYMWNAKTDENEKLKAAVQSLERLNVELSQSLNELRNSSATATEKPT